MLTEKEELMARKEEAAELKNKRARERAQALKDKQALWTKSKKHEAAAMVLADPLYKEVCKQYTALQTAYGKDDVEKAKSNHKKALLACLRAFQSVIDEQESPDARALHRQCLRFVLEQEPLIQYDHLVHSTGLAKQVGAALKKLDTKDKADFSEIEKASKETKAKRSAPAAKETTEKSKKSKKADKAVVEGEEDDEEDEDCESEDDGYCGETADEQMLQKWPVLFEFGDGTGENRYWSSRRLVQQGLVTIEEVKDAMKSEEFIVIGPERAAGFQAFDSDWAREGGLHVGEDREFLSTVLSKDAETDDCSQFDEDYESQRVDPAENEGLKEAIAKACTSKVRKDAAAGALRQLSKHDR